MAAEKGAYIRDMKTMDFGIFIRPGHYSWDHTCTLIQAAEAAGFRYVWFGDSHLIWQEVSPYLTLAAMQSETLRFGPLVTNPVTRHPASSSPPVHL